MQLTNTKTRYGAGSQVLHWLTALFVVAGWLLGQFGDVLPKGPPREFGSWTHMMLGECVVLLLVARLVWRIGNPPPSPEPMRFGRVLEIAAKLSHFTLYALLAIVPVVGVVVQLKRGHTLPVLGFWDVVSPWPGDRASARRVLGVHEILANALLILAGVHAAVALVHHYAFRDRTLVRMLPAARISA
jgi:cytochrome b561